MNAAAMAPAPAAPAGDGPAVSVGRIVHVEMAVEANGSRLAPALVTRAWAGVYDYVNATVFPDLQPPKPMGSIPRKDLAPAGWTGAVWSWPPRS